MIDTRTGHVLKTIHASVPVSFIGIDASTHHGIFTVGGRPSHAYLFDTQTGTILHKAIVQAVPQAITVDMSAHQGILGGMGYTATNTSTGANMSVSSSITVIDMHTGKFLHAYPVPWTPQGVAVDGNTGHVLASQTLGNSVVMIGMKNT